MKRRYFIWCILLLLLAAGMYGYNEFNRQRADSGSLKPKFSIDATALLNEFISNEQEANKKYGGQNIIVAVTGTIKEVSQSRNGYYTILMGDTGSLSSIHCSMDTAYATGFNQLKRGSQATIKGNFNGYKADEFGIGADVELNFCVVTNPGLTSKQK